MYLLLFSALLFFAWPDLKKAFRDYARYYHAKRQRQIRLKYGITEAYNFYVMDLVRDRVFLLPGEWNFHSIIEASNKARNLIKEARAGKVFLLSGNVVVAEDRKVLDNLIIFLITPDGYCMQVNEIKAD